MVTLVPIAPGHSLAPAPAASYARMLAAGCPLGITSSWRSPETQRYLYDGWMRRLPGFAFALPPGSSKHEIGYALDLKAAAASWVRAHPEHGWRFTNPNEWWHVDYFLVADVANAPARPGGSIPAPAPAAPEDDMRKDLDLVRRKDQAEVYIGDGLTRRHVRTADELKDLQYRLTLAGGNPEVQVVDRIDWAGQAPTAIDTAALAKAIAAALPAGSALTAAQVQAATEAGVRAVLRAV